ncbi:MAG: hypothetical protein HYS55_01995 [Candidatus Omnitrophica bacterium]|nr:hypothetical protein [Candidatus Omnitrophota bacterium]
MKKIALILALLMVFGQAYGFAYPTAVDNTLDAKSKSELHPVSDAAKIASAANDGVNKIMESEPVSTVMKPIRATKKETLKGAYKITNTLWDVLTFRWLRSEDKPEA